MITTVDGSVYTQMSMPDMRIPIQNALTYPSVIPYPFEKLDFTAVNLQLYTPDQERYPCLKLARMAARNGGAYTVVFNAANEIAVEAFIREEIHFTDIPVIIDACLDRNWDKLLGSLDQILDYDQRAREEANSRIRALNS